MNFRNEQRRRLSRVWCAALMVASVLFTVDRASGSPSDETSAAPGRLDASHRPRILYSCDQRRALHTCSDYLEGLATAMMDERQMRIPCDGGHGAFARTPCPTTVRLGSCTSGEIVYRYYRTGVDPNEASSARSDCVARHGGAWVPDIGGAPSSP